MTDQRWRRRPDLSQEGFTILEALVAVLIASTAIALIVPSVIRQVSLSREVNSLTSIESVVSRDLDWISDYSRWWRMRSGPYNITASVAQLPTGVSYTTAPEASYLPPADSCASGTLANDFQAALAVATTSPARPYAIDATSVAAQDLETVGDVTVKRSLEPNARTLRVSYSLEGGNTASLRFYRRASVLIEAAAWCERSP